MAIHPSHWVGLCHVDTYISHGLELYHMLPYDCKGFEKVVCLFCFLS